MNRREFAKSALMTSLMLSGVLGHAGSVYAKGKNPVSYKVNGMKATIEILSESRRQITARLEYGGETNEISIKSLKGDIDKFSRFGRDGQSMMMDKSKITITNGKITVTGPDGKTTTSGPVPVTSNVGPVVVIILIIIIIHGKWPPAPKRPRLMAFDGAEISLT